MKWNEENYKNKKSLFGFLRLCLEEWQKRNMQEGYRNFLFDSISCDRVTEFGNWFGDTKQLKFTKEPKNKRAKC